MALRYRVGDVVVASELPLSLPVAAPDAVARIAIERGDARGGTVVAAPGLGRAVLVADGATVRGVVSVGEYDDAVRGFVQGVVLPAALQRAGAWHLHASSVVIDGGVAALVGAPGAGKSVLAAALALGGNAFYGDDGLVISGADPPRAWLGSPHMRLSDEAAHALGLGAVPAERCATSGKRIIAPAAAGVAVEQGDLAMRALVLVERTGAAAPRLETVKAARAAVELLAAEFHPTPEQRGRDDERVRFETAVDLARRVPMRRIIVPDDVGRAAEAAAFLVDGLRASVP